MCFQEDGHEQAANGGEDVVDGLARDIGSGVSFAITDGVVGKLDCNDDGLGDGALGGGVTEWFAQGDGELMEGDAGDGERVGHVDDCTALGGVGERGGGGTPNGKPGGEHFDRRSVLPTVGQSAKRRNFPQLFGTISPIGARSGRGRLVRLGARRILAPLRYTYSAFRDAVELL